MSSSATLNACHNTPMSTPNATPNQDLPTWDIINKRQALINKIELARQEERKFRRFVEQDLKIRRAAAESTAAILASYVAKGILKPEQVPA